VARARRPCPRGLYDGCPIPRELCTEGRERTGEWHCLKLLSEFEGFVFGRVGSPPEHAEAAEGIASLEDLLRTLEGMEGGKPG
jgi:hypothetical protein